MSDNFGIIVSAGYCAITDIQACAVINQGIKVTFKANKNWSDFDTLPAKIDISVEEIKNSGVSLFKVSGKIKVSRQKFENTPEMVKFRQSKVLVKFITGNGDVLVVGDRENPVTIVHKIINPSGVDTASGVEYYLTGTQKHPELPLL